MNKLVVGLIAIISIPLILVFFILSVVVYALGSDTKLNSSCSESMFPSDMSGLADNPYAAHIQHKEEGHMEGEGEAAHYVVDKPAWTEIKQCGIANGFSTGGVDGPLDGDLSNWINWALDPSHWNSKTDGGNPGVDVDGAYGAQCADISKSWVHDRLHMGSYPLLTAQDNNSNPVLWGADIPPQAHQQPMGEKIKAGDVVFFVWGHTAIAINEEDEEGRFSVVEQNYPSPHKNAYSKGQVMGFFRLS
jgi:hypothetical protein